jgi:tagaturonate reductase
MTTLRRLDRSLRREPEFPEKAVQFGTGAFLRGFIDYFLDKANHRGLFGGRVVAIGSTGSGRDKVLNEQDGLYTLWLRGVHNGQASSNFCLIESVSRALSASTEWNEVLACARNPQLEYVFSNTTETGIKLDEDDNATLTPPRSFPGKLTRFLYERAQHFDYTQDRGLVVIPCELIENNGTQLKQIVLTLAERWGYGSRFAGWVNEAVPFCNTLVDRIVPGEPPPEMMAQAWQELGYRDDMLTVCETYQLFAIEADATTAKRLQFTQADPSIIITDDITPYRLRKVRLLNGAHTIMVPLALLSGCKTVAEAVADVAVGTYLRKVLKNELVRSVAVPGAADFADTVLDRLSNPYIRHELIDITLQQTTKMQVRVVPAILDYALRKRQAPPGIAVGFAAYLLYMRGDESSARADDLGARVKEHWRAHQDPGDVVQAVCADESLWRTDLTKVERFAEYVRTSLEVMLRDGARDAIGVFVVLPGRDGLAGVR